MKQILPIIALLFISTIVLAKTEKVKSSYVLIDTSLGKIKIKLYNETPLHRDNFLKLVKEGYFEETLFHRVIKDFMIQGGDPESKNAPANKLLGTGGPTYTIPAEIVFPKYYHKRGALSAARLSDQANTEKRSSGSQFYIVYGKPTTSGQLDTLEMQVNQGIQKKIFDRLVSENKDNIIKLRVAQNQEGLMALQEELIKKSDIEAKATSGFKYTEEQRKIYTSIGGTPFLDRDYTVFGEVIEGLDVVNKIQNAETDKGDRPTKDVKMTMKIVKK